MRATVTACTDDVRQLTRQLGQLEQLQSFVNVPSLTDVADMASETADVEVKTLDYGHTAEVLQRNVTQLLANYERTMHRVSTMFTQWDDRLAALESKLGKGSANR